MKNNKIIYRIAVLLSAFFVLNCGGGGATGNAPKPTCENQGKLSIDNTGACFKAEAIPANFQELVDIIDKKYKANHNADLNKIDVSKVTKMACLFSTTTCTDETKKRPPELTGKDFSAFNGKIDKWNTSSVISMHRTFDGAINFNGDLSHWDVSNVTNMESMFNGATNFNQDISKWNVSKVKNITGMFFHAIAFNSDISKWKVSNVTDMSHMFQGAKIFNSDISGWDVSNVTTMEEMFRNAYKFNQNLDSWKVGKVTSVAGMFKGDAVGGTDAMSFPLPSWGGKLPAGVVKTDMFKLSAVAGKEPSWCTTGCK